MKRILAASLFTTLTIFLFSSTAIAQEEARAAWRVTNLDITANVEQPGRALNAVAVLTAKNVGRAAGSTLTFRINAKATIKGVTVGGTNANFRRVPETHGNLQRVTATLPGPVAPNATVNLTVSYSLAVESNTGLSAISPIGAQFLPLSFWYPAPNTPFNVRGADTAPFRLTVNGPNVISSGVEKSGDGGSSVYEQSLNAQPFFIQGDWDRTEGTGEGKGITALLPKGPSPEERKQAEAMIALAASARSFHAALLGPAPDVPIRLISVRRGSGFNDAGTVLVESGAFRRAKLDSATALLVSEAISRLWIGG